MLVISTEVMADLQGSEGAAANTQRRSGEILRRTIHLRMTF